LSDVWGPWSYRLTHGLLHKGIDFQMIRLYNNNFIRSRYLNESSGKCFTLSEVSEFFQEISQSNNFRRKALPNGFIEIDIELCKDCKLCMSVCPHRLIESSDRLNQKGYYPASYSEKQLKKEERKCTGCSLCAIACPEIAIEVYRA
jgi:2-oxoglutarate ferredoxin oxidoreductase subunit delta